MDGPNEWKVNPVRSLRFLPLLLLAALLLQACGEGDPIVQSGTDTGGTEPAGTRPSVIGPWILVGLTIDDAPATIPPEVVFEMSIEGGQISGLAGCNQFGGDVDAADDGSFSTSDVFITEMACEPLSLLDFEQVYLGALGRATAWEVTPAGLTLSGDGVELVYELAPPAVDLTLEGTTWTFDSIYQGEGVDRAVSSTRLDKPAVTLTVAEGMATLTSDDCGRGGLRPEL